MTNEEKIKKLSISAEEAIRSLVKCGVKLDDGICVMSRAGTMNGINVWEAVEKQIPMKPVGVDFDMVGCASCKMVVVKRRDRYCPNCGQKQDWGEEE